MSGRRLPRCDAYAEMYEAGHCLREVAEAFGVSRNAVHKALLIRDVPRRPAGGARKRRNEGNPTE